MKTIHHQPTGHIEGQGIELNHRGDNTYMLRVYAGHGKFMRSLAVYLTLTDLEALFDSIGQVLVGDGERRLTEIMEAI